MTNPNDEKVDAGRGIKTSRFEKKQHDMTDVGCQVCMVLTCPLHFLPAIPGFMGRKTFVLEEEEAVLNVDCQPLCTTNPRHPCGELGSVGKHNCLCCTGVASGLSNCMPMHVGWGCDAEKVDEIVGELKRRMKAQGDAGQVAGIEGALEEIQKLRAEMGELKADVKITLKALNVPQHKPPLNAFSFSCVTRCHAFFPVWAGVCMTKAFRFLFVFLMFCALIFYEKHAAPALCQPEFLKSLAKTNLAAIHSRGLCCFCIAEFDPSASSCSD